MGGIGVFVPGTHETGERVEGRLGTATFPIVDGVLEASTDRGGDLDPYRFPLLVTTRSHLAEPTGARRDPADLVN